MPQLRSRQPLLDFLTEMNTNWAMSGPTGPDIAPFAKMIKSVLWKPLEAQRAWIARASPHWILLRQGGCVPQWVLGPRQGLHDEVHEVLLIIGPERLFRPELHGGVE